MPCAASPPSTFCQEKVTTSSLEKSSSCAKAAEVASQIVSPSRSAAIQSASGTRTPEVVPFQVKTTSRVLVSTLREVGQLAVRRLDDAGVRELELLDHVRDPALAEALPGQHVDRAGAEQRPQRHLDRAGVGGRHDADAVIGRHVQHLAGEVDGELQARLAELGAMRAAEACRSSGCARDHPGRLAQGPDEKKGARGRAAGMWSCGSILTDGRLSVGRGVPPTGMTEPARGQGRRRQDLRCRVRLRNRNTDIPLHICVS